MLFNPDKAKQVQEVIFLKKTNSIIHQHLCFNNVTNILTTNILTTNILTIKAVRQQKH